MSTHVTGRYQALRKELDAGALIARARKETGLTDFGGTAFIEPMNKLLDSAAKEVDFHTAGLESFKRDIVRCLITRLRTHDDVTKHPEILDEDVSDPIIVIGLPRSGTTKTQRMLSAPIDVQRLYLWRSLNPARFPDTKPGQPDPRIAAASQSNSSDDSPELRAAHLMTATQPDEDWGLYDSTFDDWIWPVAHFAGAGILRLGD